MKTAVEALARCHHQVFATAVQEIASRLGARPEIRKFDEHPENFEEMARLTLAVLDAAGFAIVPKEPTEAMVKASRTAVMGPIQRPPGRNPADVKHEIRLRAAIAAAKEGA